MKLHPYGFFIGLGALAAVEVSEKSRKFLATYSKFYATVSVWEGFWWIFIPALFGARFYHIIDFWAYYSQFPQKILVVWEGGMGIWGGLIGGMVGLLAYTFVVSWRQIKRQEIKKLRNWQLRDLPQCLNILLSNFFLLADLAVVGLPLGQAIGRLGNFFNQELYGLPTNLPWGIYIQPEKRLGEYESYNRFHPLFAYEMLWDLLIFLLLLSAIRRRLYANRPGFLFFIYLGLYGLGRFLLEFLRIEPWRYGLLTVGQWVSLVAIGALLLYSTKRFWPEL